MTIEQAVITRLASLAAVTALVGTRIYLDRLPKDHATYPAVRVVLVDEVDSPHLRGGGGVRTARVQVDAYAEETSATDPYTAVAGVAAAIHGDEDGTALSGWAGSIGSPALEVQGCVRVDRRRAYDPDELQVVTMSQDYRITYRG